MSFEAGEFLEHITSDGKGRRVNASTGEEVYMPGPADPQIFCRNSKHEVVRYADVLRSINGGQVFRYAYPGPLDVHVNKALSDFAVSYELGEDMFVAPKLSPVKTVEKRSDVYFTIARGDVTRDYGAKLERAVSATASDAQQAFTQSTYTSIDYALRDFLPDKIVDNADEALQLTQQTTKFLQDVMEFAWDRRVLAAIGSAGFATGTFASLAGAGATVATSALANPYITLAISAAQSAIQLANNGRVANTMVVNASLARQIASSPQVQAQTVYSPGGGRVLGDGGLTNLGAMLAGLSEQFMGLNVVVVNLPTNSAKKGASDSFSSLFAQQIGLLYVEQPSRRSHNAITTFRVGGINIRTYRDEARRGTFIEVEMDQTELPTNSYGGYLITSAGV